MIQADVDAYVAGVNQYIARGAHRPVEAAGRVPGARQGARGLEGDRHGRDRVADRRHLRQGRRRRGARRRRRCSPRGSASARRRGRAVFGDFRSLDDPEAPVDHDQALPLRPARAASKRRGRRAPRPRLDPGPRPGRRRRRRRPSALRACRRVPGLPDLPIGGLPFQRVQSNALLVGAQASRGRPPARRDGPAGRLLLARDPDGDRPPRRRGRRARRDLPRHQPLRADRPRQGLRLEHHDGQHRQRRRVRREALRADGSEPTPSRALPLQGRSACRSRSREHTLDRRRPSPTDPAAGPPPRTIRMRGPAQRARPDPGARDGRRAAGRDRRGALDLLPRARLRRRLQAAQLRRGHEPAHVPADDGATINFAFNWFYVDERDIAYITDGWYPRRAKGTDPSLPDVGHRRVGLARLRRSDFSSSVSASSCRTLEPGAATSSTGTTSRRRAGAPPTTTGRSARSSACSGSQDRVRAGIKGRRKLTLTGLTKAMQRRRDGRPARAGSPTRCCAGDRQAPGGRRVARAGAAARRAGRGEGGAPPRPRRRRRSTSTRAAVALMDRWWERLMPGIFQPALGAPLVDRDQGDQPVRADRRTARAARSSTAGTATWTRTCGGCSASASGTRCRGATAAAASCAPAAACWRARSPRRPRTTCATQYGTALAHVRIKATGCEQDPICDQIEFITAGAVATPPIPWQDRPTFQQVVELR